MSVAGQQPYLSVLHRLTSRCSASVGCAVPFFRDRLALLVLDLVLNSSSARLVISNPIAVGVLSIRHLSAESDYAAGARLMDHSTALVHR